MSYKFNPFTGKLDIAGGTTLPSAQDGEALIYENGQWVAGPVIGGVDYFTGAGDQYINDVELLMLFNGTDGSQTFTDSSSVGQTFTVTGNTNQAKISTTQSKFGGSSGFFDFGYAVASTAIQFQSNPFTVEAWIYPTADRMGSVFSNRSSGEGMELIYLAGGRIRFQRGNSPNNIETTTTVPLNTWAHVAVTRDSNDLFTVWINGVDSGSATFAGVSLGNGRPNPAVGRRADSSAQYYAGYVDDLRVTNGVCRYTADFTAPTAEFSSQSPTQTTIPYSIDKLEDVDTSTVAPTDGQALLWDNTASKWEPGTVSSGTSLPSGTTDGEALIWENGAWVTGPVIGGVDYFTGAGDQYISNVALLMNFEGTDGTQVFTDSSPNNLTLTPNGSANDLKISTTQFKYGSSSGYFYMTYLTASSAIAFNSDPFTVEAWIYRVSGQSYSSSTGWTYGAIEGDIYSARPGITFKINGSDQLEFFRGNGAAPVIASTTTIPLDVWTHVAVTRDSNNVITLWIDGVSSATQTYVDTNGVGYDLGAGGTPAIGRRNSSSTSYFFGYIDDLRITPGICRYTAAFTPPTAQLSNQLPTQTTIPYSIDKLDDVDTSTVAPTDGQALVWDATNSHWEPGAADSIRTLLGIGEYADDTAAGTGGVASGAMYYNTTSSDYRLKT